ncbi:MAG: uridine kinase [Candidatus Hydrogenedentes bacterium]|nr:uridine kinase [Candidatus Hydrogenedentota bacterium]
MDILNSFTILIGGGTASGKSSLARLISASFSEKGINSLIIPTDNYYKDLSHLPFEERTKTNFDEPNAIEHQLLISDLSRLLKGLAVNAPTYDFTTHTRLKESTKLEPSQVIIIEGLYALYYEELRTLGNLKIYVEIPNDIALIRRILRDTKERNRSLESIIEQYLKTVKPMYEKYILSTKKFADLVISGENLHQALDTIMNHPKIKDYIANFISESQSNN